MSSKKHLMGNKFSVTDSWTTANVLPVNEKESNNLINKNRPISYLPILKKILVKYLKKDIGKIFQKITAMDIFNLFQKNKILTKSWSGFPWLSN